MKTTAIATALLFCAAAARGQAVKKDTSKAPVAATGKQNSSGKTSAKKAEPNKYLEFSPQSAAQQAKAPAAAAKKYQEFSPSALDSAAKKSSGKAPAKPARPKSDTMPVKKP